MWPFNRKKKKEVEPSAPVKVSLSTHTVYPGIRAFPNGEFVAHLHRRDGSSVNSVTGKRATRQEAIEAAVAWVQSKHTKYLKEVR